MHEKHHHKQHNEMALLAISNTHRGKKKGFSRHKEKKTCYVLLCVAGVYKLQKRLKQKKLLKFWKVHNKISVNKYTKVDFQNAFSLFWHDFQKKWPRKKQNNM